LLEKPVRLDIEGLLRNLRREGTPERTYFLELIIDPEVKDAICERFDIGADLDPADLHYALRRQIALYRFLGYESMRYKLKELSFESGSRVAGQDTAQLTRNGGRQWADHAHGAIATWEDLERYPWPDPGGFDLSELEWLERNLPDDMGLQSNCHHIMELTVRLFGYEKLCFALYDQPDLVDAVIQRVGEINLEGAKALAQFERVRILFGGDDMGFKTALMVSPQVLREKVLPWHKRMAAVAHEHDKVYMLHSCGKLDEIMDDLIDDVELDALHSFQDVIVPVTEAKRRWGDRLALVGGIDMDFICRAEEGDLRQRVRDTLDACMPGGGYCLGTGNTVANYIPLDNYLIMLDEGRRYGG
jgi:uroporphyrinogen decarboxylase